MSIIGQRAYLKYILFENVEKVNGIKYFCDNYLHIIVINSYQGLMN